jgi:initiation factor 1A
MVKNTTGGNKAKGKARKSYDITNSKQPVFLRTSQSEFELYAQVTKNLGNGMCHVQCIDDGRSRLCHIRGKFRGRGKGDNIVRVGSWLLVGLREWEHSCNPKKLENCDLLEVYSELEKDKLKNTVKIDWALFISNDNKNSNNENSGPDSFVFTDEKTDEYLQLIEEGLSGANKGSSLIAAAADEDEINVDDI